MMTAWCVFHCDFDLLGEEGVIGVLRHIYHWTLYAAFLPLLSEDLSVEVGEGYHTSDSIHLGSIIP